MTQLFRLDKAHTDLTAPRIPHGIGVAGATRRYIPDFLPQAAGTTVTRQPDELGTIHLNRADSGHTVQQDASGFKYLRGSTLTELASVAGDTTGPLTFAAVVRKPKTGPGKAITVGGYDLERAANGQWSFRVRNGASQLLASSDGWGLYVASCDGANSAIDQNGATTAAPGLVAPTSLGHRYTGIGAWAGSAQGDAEIAELIVWPFTMTAAQRALVRTAMKARYSVLP